MMEKKKELEAAGGGENETEGPPCVTCANPRSKARHNRLHPSCKLYGTPAPAPAGSGQRGEKSANNKKRTHKKKKKDSDDDDMVSGLQVQ
jgi:hypothetical protein